MRSPAFAQLSDEALFAEVLRQRSCGEDVRGALGELCERWRAISYAVVRRVQASYLRGSPEDAADIFQDAVGKLIARGLEQFRGVSQWVPGQAVAPRTFFLRIVKHAAIDRYRRLREDVVSELGAREEAPREAPAQVARSLEAARQSSDHEDAASEYWAAFERLRREHPKEAAAWDLYHHQDLDDHEACARALGITVVNSYKRVSRAQAHLKLYVLELRGEREEEGP